MSWIGAADKFIAGFWIGARSLRKDRFELCFVSLAQNLWRKSLRVALDLAFAFSLWCKVFGACNFTRRFGVFGRIFGACNFTVALDLLFAFSLYTSLAFGAKSLAQNFGACNFTRRFRLVLCRNSNVASLLSPCLFGFGIAAAALRKSIHQVSLVVIFFL